MTGNQSLQRGLAILDRMAALPAPQGVREIAVALKLSPSIVQRLINTLAAAGYVERDPATRRYSLGHRALVIGAAIRRDDRLLDVAAAELAILADAHRLNGYLGAIKAGEIVYLESVQSSGPIAVKSPPGAKAPAHSTALGKALLAELDPGAVAAIVGPAPYRAFTPRTIVATDALAAELALTRKRGYAIADRENIEQVVSVGAVVRDAKGKAVAALSVAYLATEKPARAVKSVARLVVAAAARCSEALGYSGARNVSLSDGEPACLERV